MALSDKIDKVVNGQCRDPFAILGMHVTDQGIEVRVFIPNASAVLLLDKFTQIPLLELNNVDSRGFFVGCLPNQYQKFAYQLDIHWGDYHEIRDDPYHFGLFLQEMDTWLLKQGKFLDAYQKLGSHPITLDDTEGVMFSVWAPNAKRVSVVGDFNFWDGRQHPMRLRQEIGVWELFLPQAKVGQLYKYELIDINNDVILKADPYAFCMEVRPNTASRIVNFPAKSNTTHHARPGNHFDQPIAIYEVHLSSWRRHDNNHWLSYRELADTLIPYVKEMGFTHIELLPITEHPFDGSWGYQPIGLYSPTSRFGSPSDFAYFLDKARQQNLYIILDWVPAHFPEDAHGLRLFDGTPLYEYSDPKEGYHQDWHTLIYNYKRYEVRNYLISNALYWVNVYGIDGFRFDAVASMIYRDYSRKDGEWVPNQYGGKENLEAISFLKEINQDLGRYCKDVITIAEESTDYPYVTKPPENNGLGFHYKWNMGWMHDTLNYLKLDPIYRKHQHDLLTFGVLYTYSENYVLPISHDEVVHGKGSLLNKMWGDEWQKFAGLRAYYAFMWAYPGKKLLFMGCEFAQKSEWNHDSQLDWYLLNDQKDNKHVGTQQLIKDLNAVYRSQSALYECDYTSKGFQWLVVDDCNNSIFVFERIDQQDRRVIVISNFTPNVHYDYRIGINYPGEYQELINTDLAGYGGSDVKNPVTIKSENKKSHDKPYSLLLTIPPLATLYIVRSLTTPTKQKP